MGVVTRWCVFHHSRVDIGRLISNQIVRIVPSDRPIIEPHLTVVVNSSVVVVVCLEGTRVEMMIVNDYRRLVVENVDAVLIASRCHGGRR